MAAVEGAVAAAGGGAKGLSSNAPDMFTLGEVNSLGQGVKHGEGGHGRPELAQLHLSVNLLASSPLSFLFHLFLFSFTLLLISFLSLFLPARHSQTQAVGKGQSGDFG